MLSTQTLPKNRRPNWVLDLHRFLGGLSVVFAFVHIAGLMLDSYIGFGPTEVLVPFTSAYRPGAVALGVIAMYMLAAVEITSLMRKHLTKRAWKLVHTLSFALYTMGSIHVIMAGTDGGTSWIQYTVFVTSALIAGLTIIRVDQSRRSSNGARIHRPRPQRRPARRASRPPLAPSGRTTNPGPFAPLVEAAGTTRPIRRPPLTTTGSTRSHRVPNLSATPGASHPLPHSLPRFNDQRPRTQP